MSKMTYKQIAEAIERWMKTAGDWSTSKEIHENACPDQDLVRVQLAISEMRLKPPHTLVSRPNPFGRGLVFCLRTPNDPPFVAPEKKTRAKRTIELTKPVAAPAQVKSAYVRPGNVAETPPEVRKEEPDTMPVTHPTVSSKPANHALAEAFHKTQTAFAEKRLDYAITKDTKAQVVPAGVSGSKPKPAVHVKPEVRPEFVPQPQTPGMMLDILLGAVRSMIQSTIDDAIATAMKSPEILGVLRAQIQAATPPASVPRHNPAPPAEEKVRLPKVCVIGLPKAHQESEVKDCFSNRLNVITINPDVNRRIIRKYCENADHVVVLRDHISHGITMSLNSFHIAHDLIHGGVQKTKEKLEEIAMLHLKDS